MQILLSSTPFGGFRKSQDGLKLNDTNSFSFMLMMLMYWVEAYYGEKNADFSSRQ
jgi:hypothetical protein